MNENDIVQKCGEKAFNIGLKADSLQNYGLAIVAMLNIFSTAISEIVDKLRDEVARAGADIAMKIGTGFDAIYTEAKGEFQQVLIRTVQYSTKEKSYQNALANLRLRYPDVDEEKIKSPPHNTEQDRVILFAIFLVSIVSEGIIGAFLLGEVLAGGYITGAVFAFAISLVNILGLGFFMGKVFDYMHRKKAIQSLWFGLWLTLVLAINGGIAWYRYESVSTFNEAGGINPVLAMFLFALLGIVFACYVFYKIYTGWYPESLLHKQWKELADERQSYVSDVNKIFDKYKSNSDSCHQEVGSFYQGLRGLLLAADAEWGSLKVKYTVARPIIERRFLAGYIAIRPTENPGTEDLPPNIFPKWEDWTSEFKSRDVAREILNKWDSSERESFVERHKQVLDDLNKASDGARKRIFQNADIVVVDSSSDNNQQV